MIEKIRNVAPKLHIFVCVNDRSLSENSNGMPSCGPRMTRDHVKELKAWIRQQGLLNDVMVTATGCLGYCSKDSCTMAVYPKGKFFKGVHTLEDIKRYIKENIGL